MILTEQYAYRNRWRGVSADARAAFAALAFVGAFVARHPFGQLALAAVLAALTVVGAGIPLRSYARVASAPWSFVLLSAVTLLRHLHAPATLVEIMTVSYRALFVLSDVAHDMGRAQAARLGYSPFSGTAALGWVRLSPWRPCDEA